MPNDQVTSPWPRRFALATLLVTIPLILFGGTVTTLREGMAESGWLRPDGYFLWLYPLEMRIRNVGTFVEHHHREFGSLVGMLAIGLVVTTFRFDKRRGARWLAMATLIGICIQGAIGGFRVLENNPDLAFLHGAIAHAVFALIGSNAFVASSEWRSARAARVDGAGFGRLHTATVLTAVAVYAQIVVGAWLRHTGVALALALHFALAALVVVEVVRTSRGLDRAPDTTGRLAATARSLRRLVGAQVALGFAAALGVYGFSGGFQGDVSGFELVFATLHVLIGAMLLWRAVGAAMWSRKLLPATQPAPAVPQPSMAPALSKLEATR